MPKLLVTLQSWLDIIESDSVDELDEVYASCSNSNRVSYQEVRSY